MTAITESENHLIDMVLTGGRTVDELPPVEAFTGRENREVIAYAQQMAARTTQEVIHEHRVS
jgi:hypothetical protein